MLTILCITVGQLIIKSQCHMFKSYNPEKWEEEKGAGAVDLNNWLSKEEQDVNPKGWLLVQNKNCRVGLWN